MPTSPGRPVRLTVQATRGSHSLPSRTASRRASARRIRTARRSGGARQAPGAVAALDDLGRGAHVRHSAESLMRSG